MDLLILASGKGVRMGDYTKNLPKCMININGKPTIKYMQKFINKFNNVLIVLGHQSKAIKDYFKNYNNIKFIYNKNFKITNMVESIFCANKFVKNDLVIVYSDIVFDPKIYDLLKTKNNIMPVNQSWKAIWKKRMNYKKIKKDAENIIIRGNKLVEIGEKIQHKLPEYQFMGIIKLLCNDYKSLCNFYKKKIKNKKIDLTNFINLSLKEKNLKVFCKKTKKFWFEIDTVQDLKALNKMLHKIKW
tara:strand:- start:70 stop:801 length:732 start_codon:yes stop_codon:yes gene_type:complete